MAEIGYTHDVVDGMEVWIAADALGVGGEDRDPAPVGSRGISLKSDGDEDGSMPVFPSTLDRMNADPSLSGSSVSGEDW